MTFEEITNGLRQLLSDNNYNPATIRFYEREWSKIHSYLTETYGDSMFDMERGLHMNKAGIRRDKNKHSGFHSMRHSAGSMLLDLGTPLPVITTILGHSDMDVTGIYLKTDLEKLAECVLAPEGEVHE